MYRSQIKPDLLNPSVQQAFRDCNDMHRNLMKAFDVSSSDEPRKDNSLLYTVMNYGNAPVLYVLSKEKPDWSRVPGFDPIDNGEPKEISALKDVFQKDGVFQFRLFASPTKKVAREGKLSGRVFLRTEEERLDWLVRHAEKCGFKIMGAHEEGRTEIKGSKNKNFIRYTGVTFCGTLIITDAEAFWNAYCCGIGPGKSYGLGMLMVRR